MALSKYAVGRDNNFNLIRIIAAIAVLIGHSFSLLGYQEPLSGLLGMSVGTMAVDVFFISSGFLVGKSLLVRASAMDYLASRFLRIFPALIILTVFSVLLVGPLFTSLAYSSYFTNPETYKFLFKGMTVLAGISMSLPGVFENHKFTAMNGSLWTIIYELKMYLLLLIFWAIFKSIEKLKINASKIISLDFVITVLAISSGVLLVMKNFSGKNESHLIRFIFMFFTGVSFYIWREKIRLRPRYFLFFAGLELCALYAGKEIFFAIYSMTISYLLFYLAYVPAGFIRKFNVLGDYSYGAYIYAFPIQQMIIALVPGVSVVAMIISSVLMTALLAILSWHYVENPILDKKEEIISKLQMLRYKLFA